MQKSAHSGQLQLSHHCDPLGKLRMVGKYLNTFIYFFLNTFSFFNSILFMVTYFIVIEKEKQLRQCFHLKVNYFPTS